MRWIIYHADDIDRFFVHAAMVAGGLMLLCTVVACCKLLFDPRPMTDDELDESFRE